MCFGTEWLCKFSGSRSISNYSIMKWSRLKKYIHQLRNVRANCTLILLILRGVATKKNVGSKYKKILRTTDADQISKLRFESRIVIRNNFVWIASVLVGTALQTKNIVRTYFSENFTLVKAPFFLNRILVIISGDGTCYSALRLFQLSDTDFEIMITDLSIY